MNRSSYNQKRIIAIWNQLSEYWNNNFGEKDILKHEIFDPIIIDVVKKNKPRLVLDAGCGEGYLSRKIAPLVNRLVAVDMSKKMIRIAQRKSAGFPNINYRIGNCRRMAFLREETIDCIIGQMLLNNVVDFKGLLREFNRISKKGAPILLSFLHPCFTIPQGSFWSKREMSYIKIITDYFSEGLKEFHLNEKKILNYHRTISTVFNGIIESGFIIKKVVEPKATNNLIKHNPKYTRMKRIPGYILVISTKR